MVLVSSANSGKRLNFTCRFWPYLKPHNPQALSSVLLKVPLGWLVCSFLLWYSDLFFFLNSCVNCKATFLREFRTYCNTLISLKFVCLQKKELCFHALMLKWETLKNCKCCGVIIRNDSSRKWFFQENLNINNSPWYEMVECYLPRRQGFDLHVHYLGIFSLMGTEWILKEAVHFCL